MPSFSRSLEQALHRALALAGERRHEYATLEHLLLALIDDQDAAAVMRACNVDLYTDSQYVRGGVMGWIKNWKRNGWRTADKKPVKNVDLWQRLDAAAERHNVEWHWVKGHAGDEMNERADELAREGMAPYKARARSAG